MRFTSFSTIFALGTALLAAASPTPAPAPGLDVSITLGGYTVNSDGSISRLGSSEHINPGIVTPSTTKRDATPVLPHTNAERLARGLPLKKARVRSSGHHKARAPVVSPVPGYIQVKNSNTGALLGYVSATQTSLGNYGSFAPDTSTALRLQVPTSSGTQISILTLNGPSSSVPYLGGLTGAASTSSDISSTSYNYLFISGTSETASGATPQTGSTTYRGASVSSRKIESAIWSYDAGSGSLTPVWINSDGSSHPATLFRQEVGASSYFGFTAGYNTYFNQFNSQGAVTPLTFTFVQG